MKQPKSEKYTKAYLVKLSGMGDNRWYLLNEEDWKHLDACANWDRHGDEPAPVPPDALIERVLADAALSMPASLFDGERYDDYDGSVRALNAFVTKHKLKIDDEYEGGIY